MKTSNKKFNKRLVASLALLVTLIMMPVSAIIVHTMHLNVTVSHKWLHIHVFFGVIFVIAGIWHVVINWRTLKFYLTGKK